MRRTDFLQDRFGHRYTIDFEGSSELWTIHVWDGGLPAAYLWARYSRDRSLRIQDFKVADDVRAPEGILAGFFRKLFGLQPRAISYQRRGIGTALISWLVSYADSRGVSRIEGELAERDLLHFPGLAEWYGTKGFALTRDMQEMRIVRYRST